MLRSPMRLGALLAAFCALPSEAWWPFGGGADADVSGKYAEFDPAGTMVSHGVVVKQGGNNYEATFPGKPWSPAPLVISGSEMIMGAMKASVANGVVTFPNGWNWKRMPDTWVPPAALSQPQQGYAPPVDEDSGTCSWKPVDKFGANSTVCYGHNVKSSTVKDAAECLDTYAKDVVCKFASFDASSGTCYCKYSCPAPVSQPSTTSFEKVLAAGGITGKYVEYDPNGALGKAGTVVQTGSKLVATFPGHSWSPGEGFFTSASELSMFGGALSGYHNDGTITFANGWKWVFDGSITPEEAGQADATQAIRDERGVSNEGWVSSRDQTPHIVQEPSELVDFAWRAAANVSCEVSEEDIKFYDEHGWVHLKQVLDPGALDLILDEAQTICKKQLATRAVCQIEQLRWQVNRFRDFMLYSPMGCYAHKLIRGKGVRITTEALFGTKYNAKRPNFFSYGFHVDSMNGHRGMYHAFHGRSKGVSIWFPMHDVDPDVTGGSVFVVDEYTGNKVKHHCKHVECGGQVQTSRSLMPQPLRCTSECANYKQPEYEKKRVTFKFKKGDVVFWHPEMPHATQPITQADFRRYSFTIRLIDTEAEVCNVGGNCGDWMGCCSDLRLANGNIHNHCFPQIYPQVLDEEVAAHYSSTPKHLMGDQSWVDFAHTIKQAPDCL